MKRLFDRQRLPFTATLVVGILLYCIGGLRYSEFFTPGVVCNFFNENPFLGIVAIGMTFVILSGGIDLSVGSVVGCTSILLATLIENYHWNLWLAMIVVLAGGTLLGTGMGLLIRLFGLPPFLVTLAGLFFCRGLALRINEEQVPITDLFFKDLGLHKFHLNPTLIHYVGNWWLRFPAVIFFVVLIIAVIVSLYTRFGRNTYALGGNEFSSQLMGLPVGRTKILIYSLSGFCSALAGIVATIKSAHGYPLEGQGLELDAIAAVVVGGTLLSGGVGYVGGTLIGVLIYAIIRKSIDFMNVNSWWTPIVVGILLFVFILLQKLIQRRAAA